MNDDDKKNDSKDLGWICYSGGKRGRINLPKLRDNCLLCKDFVIVSRKCKATGLRCSHRHHLLYKDFHEQDKKKLDT